jgi:hypothetical protein
MPPDHAASEHNVGPPGYDGGILAKIRKHVNQKIANIEIFRA